MTSKFFRFFSRRNQKETNANNQAKANHINSTITKHAAALNIFGIEASTCNINATAMNTNKSTRKHSKLNDEDTIENFIQRYKDKEDLSFADDQKMYFVNSLKKINN